MRRKALKQKNIWNPALFGIRNPLSWNPESSTRNPESTGWNPESKTVMDSLTWGEVFIVVCLEFNYIPAWIKETSGYLAPGEKHRF